jgi:hypothetical protein
VVFVPTKMTNTWRSNQQGRYWLCFQLDDLFPRWLVEVAIEVPANCANAASSRNCAVEAAGVPRPAAFVRALPAPREAFKAHVHRGASREEVD